MKRTMIPCSLALVAGGAMALSGFADYDVLLNIEGGSRVERYSVSADGTTWTKGANFLASSTPMNFAAPGDGYVYVPNGTTIDRYTKGGVKVDTWKSDLSGKVRIFLSPDHVWFYIANNWNSSENVARYRVSDPSIGGFLSLNDAAHGSLNGTNNRDITFGRDGVMYLGCRGNNITDPTAANYGVNDMGRGVFAYDVTVSGAPLLKRYPLDGNKSGVGVFIDDDRDRLIANDTKFRYFKLGYITQYQDAKTSPGGTAFYTFNLGGMKFFGDYNGKVHRYNPDNDTYSTVALNSSNVAAISDITDANSGSQLPYITGVWYMNESTGTKVINGANPGVMDMETSGEAKLGFRGAARHGLRLRTGGLATIKNSSALVPATGDFTIGLWVKSASGTVAFSNGATTLGLDAEGKPTLTAGGVTIAGATALRSAWHALMACREGGTLRLYVDNVEVASGALDAATALGGSANWTLQATAALVDELRVYPKILTASDRALLDGLVRPEAQKAIYAYDDTTAKKLGSIVTHRDPVLGDVASPSAVAVGSTAYVAVVDRVYASADGGVTWSEKGSTGLDAVSLFADAGALYAVGLDGDGNLALGTTANGGATWATAKIGGGLSVPTLRPTQPVVANGRVWLGAVSADAKSVYAVSFAFAGGVASDPKCATATAVCANALSAVACAVDAAGTVRMYASNCRPTANDGEYLVMMSASSASSVSYSRVLVFPGASKPVAIAYDAQTKRYWLVAAAWHMNDRVKDVFPQLRAPTLALYSSADLDDWYGHGDLTDLSVPAQFSAPSLTIVGDDLVIAAQTNVDDGLSVARRDADAFNQVLAVRVANFRRFWTPRIAQKTYHPRELLVCEETDKLLTRSYREDATGDWLPSGILVDGRDEFLKDDGVTKVKPDKMVTVRSWNDRVFVSESSKNAGVFEFKKTGEFVRYYPLPANPDGMCVSADGSKIYATHWWGTKLYTIDRASNVCTTKDFGSSVLSVPRGVADLGDGRIVISSRGNQSLVIYDTVHDAHEHVTGKFGTSGNGPQEIFYDPTNGRLYLTSNSAGSGYYDIASGTYTKLSGSAYHGFARYDDNTIVGALYGTPDKLATDAGSMDVFSESATSLTSPGFRVMRYGGLVNRCWTIENPKPVLGLSVIVR